MLPGHWMRCAPVGIDPRFVGASCVLAGLIALPSLAAFHRRRRSREGSEVASALAEFADAIRREQRCLGIDETLLTRAHRLNIPEMISFDLLRKLPAPTPALLADAAQRLALRLKRRVAFERKMLARTASGRRRGALAAAAPALVMLVLATAGVALPPSALAMLLTFEGIGCWLLLQVARIEA